MVKFIHHLLNPHCPDCILERQEKNVCKSCETLTMELERLRSENQYLLDKLLKEPEVIKDSPPSQITRPMTVPWAARRQMLEAEDRKKAQLLRDSVKPSTSNKAHIEELERELGVEGVDGNTEGIGTHG